MPPRTPRLSRVSPSCPPHASPFPLSSWQQPGCCRADDVIGPDNVESGLSTKTVAGKEVAVGQYVSAYNKTLGSYVNALVAAPPPRARALVRCDV
eukprot:1924001-Rhodomonas_salina.1